MGKVYIKIFWFGEVSLNKPQENVSLNTKSWVTDIELKISRTLKQKSMHLFNSFKFFDRDEDGIISSSDFKIILKGKNKGKKYFII